MWRERRRREGESVEREEEGGRGCGEREEEGGRGCGEREGVD